MNHPQIGVIDMLFLHGKSNCCCQLITPHEKKMFLLKMAGSPIQYLQIKLSNGIQKHLITDKVRAFKNSKR